MLKAEDDGWRIDQDTHHQVVEFFCLQACSVISSNYTDTQRLRQRGGKTLDQFSLTSLSPPQTYISQTKRIRNKLFRKQLFIEVYRGIEEVPVFLFLLLSSTHTNIHDVGADMIRVSIDMPVHLVNAL